jgi:hypothetical protein
VQLAQPYRNGNRRHGDDAGTTPSPTLLRRSEFSAAGRLGDGSPADAAASGSAAQVAAARCEAVRRNCCTDLEVRFQRAASGRVPDNPHSNTAPSNRADIAFVCLAKPAARATEGKAIAARAPRMQKRQNWRDCAPEALVSQGESIQLVVVLLQNCGKHIRRI